MAVKYGNLSGNQLTNLLGQDLLQQAAANNAYNVIGQKAGSQAATQNTGPLESFLGGLGNTISNVGKSIYGLIGTGVASIGDLLGGSTNKAYDLNTMQEMIDKNKSAGTSQENIDSMQKALDLAKQNNMDKVRGYFDDQGRFQTSGEGKNVSEFKKSIWGTDNKGVTNYAKAAGESLDAASTLSNFIPGANGIAGNAIQGAASGFGQSYADTGGDLESALKAAAASGLAGAATGGLNKGLNNAIAKGGKLANFATNKPLLNTIGRGALSGAVGGAVGGGTAAGLNGGDVLAGATQGAVSGAKGGAVAAPVMYGANKLISKTPLGGVQAALNEMEQEYQPKQKTKNLPQQTVENQVTPDEEVKLMYGESDLANGTNTKTSLGKKIAKTLQGSQANLARKEARDIGIESAGDVVDKTYKRTGISDLQKQAVLANELTGAGDSLLDSIQRVALGATEDGKPRYVDITKVAENVDSTLDKNIPQTALSGKAREQLSKNIKADLYNNDIDTITKANNIRSTAMEYVRKSKTTPDIADINTAKALFQIADDIDDLSYSAVPKENIDAMYDTAISELRGRAKIADNNGVKDASKAYNKLADELSNTERTIENYRSFKKDFVNSSKVYQKTAAGNTAWNYNAGTIGTAALASAMSGNPLVGVPVAIASKALAIPAGELATQGLAKIGGKLSDISDTVSSKIGKNSGKVSNPTLTYDALNNRIGTAIGRAEGARAAGNSLEAQLANMNTNEALQATQNGLNGDYYAGATGYGATTTPNAYNTQGSTGNNMLSRIEIGIQNAFNAGDFDSVKYLMDMYNTMAKSFGSNNTTKATSDLNATQQQNLVKLQTAGSALDKLEELFDKAGGGQGIIAGNVNNFLGNIGLNSDNSTYNQLAEGLINQIAAAVGKTDSLNTEGEVDRAMSLIPKITDDAQTAKNKLAELRSMLESTSANYNQIYGLI